MATGTWIYEKGTVTGGGGGGGTGGGVPAPDVSIEPPVEVIFRSDHKVEVDVEWNPAPTATKTNFLGVAVYLEDPDISTGENHVLDGGSMPLDGTAQVSGEWAPVFYSHATASPAVILLDTASQTYKSGRDIRIYLAAYGPYSQPHVVRATDTNPTPNTLVYIPQGRGQGESGQEWAFLVTLPNDAVTVIVDYNRVDPQYSLKLKYTPPDPSIPVPPGVNHFGGVRIVFVYENDSGGPIFPGSDTGINIPANQGEAGFETSAWKTKGEPGQYRVYFVSEDDSQPLGNHCNSLVEGTTPFAHAIIPGIPPVPSVTNFTISNQKIVWLMDGSMIAQATFSWHLPDAVQGIRYAGVYLYLVNVTGSGTPLTTFPQDLTGPHSNVETAYLLEIANIPKTVESWTIAAISYDNNGKFADGQDPKNYGKPGFTSPTVTWAIGPPVSGSPGSADQFAPLVTLGTGASAKDTQTLSSDGVNMVSFNVGPWINPDDNKFGNAQVAMVINTDWSKPTFYTVPANATSFQTPSFPSFGNIGAPVTVDFYLVSDDPQGNKNPLVPGGTPKIPFTYTPKAGAIIPARSGWFDDTQFSWVDGSGLTADRIEANAIYVGKTLVVGGSNDTSFAGQSNGQIAVKNASGTLRAWMGEQQPGQGTQGGVPPLWGGWFGQLWVGGTSPLDAPLWIDDNAIIQVGGIKARQGTSYPYISIRDDTGLEMGRIGAKINISSGPIGSGDNVGPTPPAQLTSGAWFSQLAVGGSNLSNWNVLIIPSGDHVKYPLGSQFLMRNISQLSIDYQAQTGPPSNPEYVLEFGDSVWSAATGASQWQFPGIHIYAVDKTTQNPTGQNLFGSVFLNRGMVLRGKQSQGYSVIASLVTYNGQQSGADSPGDFWGELTLNSPKSPYRTTVSLASGADNDGSPHLILWDVDGNLLFAIESNGYATFKGPLLGVRGPHGEANPLNAYAYNVGGYPGAPAKPVIDSAGNWVGNTIPAPPPIGQTPWTSDIQGAGHSLSGVATVTSDQYAMKGGTVVINTSGNFVGPGVDVGLGHSVYGSYLATNQYLDSNHNPIGANQIDTGTLNVSKSIVCTGTFSAAVFSPSSINCPGDIRAGGNFTGGQFQGSGIWIPDYGIRCGSMTVANAAGAGQNISCGSISVGSMPWPANPNNETFSVNCVTLRIGGVERIDLHGIYRGGLQFNDHCYAQDFGIVGQYLPAPDGTFYDRDGGVHHVRGGILTSS